VGIVAEKWEQGMPGASVDDAGSGSPSGYELQLRRLPIAYEAAMTADIGPLVELLERTDERQTLFVGSGGALAVATLAADLSAALHQCLAQATTPLGLVGKLPLMEAAVVMFSAGGRHPDARIAVSRALSSNCSPVGVVTHRRRDELAAVFGHERVAVVTLPASERKEGFLATASVLTMASAIVRAYGYTLPAALPSLGATVEEPLRENCIVLFAPGYEAVAVDLETRLNETGLARVQLTDYRNFAHGRHHGYSRQINDTSVVALVGEPYEAIAQATLSRLPASAHIVRLESGLAWPLAALDLLGASMRLVGATAGVREIDPARPRVPTFGRHLYHLPTRSLLPDRRSDPVERKLTAAHTGNAPEVRRFYERALSRWLRDAETARFGGVVLDYDGTVCATPARFKLPGEGVQAVLVDLLEAGLVLGFASGRGGSLWRDLRAWVPEKYRAQIELGLYNGGVQLSLADELDDDGEVAAPLQDAARRLNTGIPKTLVDVELRPQQISIASSPGSGLGTQALARITAELLGRPPRLDLKVTSSAHSIDVVPSDSVKTTTIERVQARTKGRILAIGDQGQLGGNDFELLAAVPLSLSVDRCSADPTRCWNLDKHGRSGPELLVRYLKALQRRRDGFSFRPRL
jgi:hypothetical protein